MFSTVVGTPGFMAPEMYLKLAYNYSVDVFALGLVFLAVMTHKKGKGLCPVSCEWHYDPQEGEGALFCYL